MHVTHGQPFGYTSSKRVIVTPSIYQRFLEFHNSDVQSIGQKPQNAHTLNPQNENQTKTTPQETIDEVKTFSNKEPQPPSTPTPPPPRLEQGHANAVAAARHGMLGGGGV